MATMLLGAQLRPESGTTGVWLSDISKTWAKLYNFLMTLGCSYLAILLFQAEGILRKESKEDARYRHLARVHQTEGMPHISDEKD